MAQFEVQTVDPASGMESWTLVSAPTADDARSRIAGTGMVVGAARLKSIDEPTPATARTPSVTPASDQSLHGAAKIILVAVCLVAIGWFVVKAVDYYDKTFGDGAAAAEKFRAGLEKHR